MNDDIHTSSKMVLIVKSATKDFPGIQEILKQLGEVREESTLSSALTTIGLGGVDLLVSSASDILTAEHNEMGVQLNIVLDMIGQAFCVLDLQGQVIWSNSRFRDLPWEVQDRIRRHCREAYNLQDGRQLSGRTRTLSLTAEGDQYYDARITYAPDQNGVERLVVSISDVSGARRLQKKMDTIDNAGREIVQVDAKYVSEMHSSERLKLLESKILRYTRELLHYDNFAIRLVEPSTNRLALIWHSGLPPEVQEFDLYVSPEGNGISGFVASTGRSYICPDTTQDPRYLPGINNARSSLTVPLRLYDKVIGVINIESERPAAFSEEDRQFTEIFARYIAISLHIMDLLVVERHAVVGQLADNVSAEIAGPLSDILDGATTLIEDYIGHDDLRHRLQGIIDNVAKIRASIKHVAMPVQGLLESQNVPPENDEALAGKRIVVIDDEEFIRTTVRDVLAKSGCEVDMAVNGHDALVMIQECNYDLVISDIKMPGANGYEIFREVKKLKPGCPVMFMTGFGYDPTHSIIKATPEGLDGVLYKPFKVNELISAVRNAILGTRPK